MWSFQRGPKIVMCDPSLNNLNCQAWIIGSSAGWTHHSTMNSARINAAQAFLELSDGRVWVCGGGAYPSGNSYQDTMETLELDDTWDLSTHTLPIPLLYHNTVEIAPGRILIVGGWKAGNTLNDQVHNNQDLFLGWLVLSATI